jgi:hypothetical protein
MNRRGFFGLVGGFFGLVGGLVAGVGHLSLRGRGSVTPASPSDIWDRSPEFWYSDDEIEDAVFPNRNLMRFDTHRSDT